MTQPHNIYIHVPYCMSKCNYCAFFSRPDISPDWNAYAEKILTEISHWRKCLGSVSVPTIFFGGGTPSLMPIKVFEKILSALHENFQISPTAEITLESNPGTLTGTKLSDFQALGVNRLSVGVQSLNDDKLRFLGRKHCAQDSLNLLSIAMHKNLRVSADFIYGLPDDTVSDIKQICTEINKLGLTHCSLYELTIEPGTPFFNQKLNMPKNTEMADMYNAIDDMLNIPRYEVSNYALAGCECRHNQNVWDGEPYLGIGIGSAGRVLLDGLWYEQRGNNTQFDKMDSVSRAIEMVITGLRQTRGVKLTPEIQRVIDTDFISQNPELFIQYTTDNRLAVTKSGTLILDSILQELIK